MKHNTPSLLLLFNFVLLGILNTACSADEESDAYGQFEAVKVTVSAETGGKLLRFRVNEGDKIEANRQVGLIDTTDLVLKRRELRAQLNATRARITNINAQVDVQREQLQTAQIELNRIQALLKAQAATQKQLDDVQGQVRTSLKQIQALETQKQSVRAEMEAIRARISQIEEQIEDAKIINPVSGTVLTTYAEPLELIQPGQPLYQIAGLDTLILRVYISGAQLPRVNIGQDVQVLVDENAEENRAISGTVSWIASEAEFTPKMIQTKEERVTQVYAVKVRVANPNGLLKIGMPAEVNFNRESLRVNME